MVDGIKDGMVDGIKDGRRLKDGRRMKEKSFVEETTKRIHFFSKLQTKKDLYK